MTDRNNGSWDAPTDYDDKRERDSGDLSGEDPPTTRASDALRARARDAAIANQLATAPAPPKSPATTLPPPPTQRPPASAIGMPAPASVVGSSFDDNSVVLLDRVSANAPVGHAPRRSESAAGGIVVVATGSDAERVRKLCHKHGLLVPVMASLGVVHDAMSIVVIGEPSPPAADRVVHVVRPAVSDDRLLELLRTLVSGRVLVDPPAVPAASDPTLADAARRLASLTDRSAIEATAIVAITALTGADRAHCLFHDPASGALWSEARKRDGNDDRHAMGGLVGWAAQTGQAIHASPAGDDPRWLLELDDPEGKPQSRLLVQPIIGADRRVHAVLVAVRRWRHSDFSEREVKALATFAALAGPSLDLAVAASPAAPAKPRSTRPGPIAASSLGAPPRPTSDSRPPPVTARKTPSQPPPTTTAKPTTPASGVAGPTPPVAPPTRRPSATDRAPLASKRPAVDLVPLVEPTRVDELTRVDSQDAEPSTIEGRTKSLDATKRDRVPPSMGDERSAPVEATKVDERYSSESILSLPSPPSVVQSTPPVPTPVARARPATLTERRTGPARARTTSDVPARQPRASSDPVDLAVVVSDADAKRVHRIAKKARLELSTFAKLGDAPDFYQVVTIGETWSPNSDARVAYAARSTITDDQLGDLLVGLTTRRAVAPRPALLRPQSAAEARRSQLAFAGARKLAAATDLAAAEEIATSTLNELLDIDRSHCLFVDPDTGALWSELRRQAGGDDRRAIAGIAGWAARTGRPVNIARASADPRWLGPIDDPDGDPNSQLLVQPIIRADDRVHGLLIAVRRPRRPGFTDTDATLLARFAALAAPLFQQVALHVDTQALVGEDTSMRSSLPSAPDPLWFTIARGQHPASRWIFLAIGAVIGLLVGLLA